MTPTVSATSTAAENVTITPTVTASPTSTPSATSPTTNATTTSASSATTSSSTAANSNATTTTTSNSSSTTSPSNATSPNATTTNSSSSDTSAPTTPTTTAVPLLAATLSGNTSVSQFTANVASVIGANIEIVNTTVNSDGSVTVSFRVTGVTAPGSPSSVSPTTAAEAETKLLNLNPQTMQELGVTSVGAASDNGATPTPSPSSSMTVYIIVAAIGGVVLIALVAFAVIYSRMSSRKARDKEIRAALNDKEELTTLSSSVENSATEA